MSRGQLHRFGREVVDDATLGAVAVGRERFAEREQLDAEPGPRRVQGVGGTGETGAKDETIGANDVHRRLLKGFSSRLRSTAATECVSAPMLMISTPRSA